MAIGDLSMGLGSHLVLDSVLLNRESQYKSTFLTFTSLYHLKRPLIHQFCAFLKTRRVGYFTQKTNGFMVTATAVMAELMGVC